MTSICARSSRASSSGASPRSSRILSPTTCRLATTSPSARPSGRTISHLCARVLILDEPTANLDVRVEAALYDRFLEITAGLTTIVISHRFSTVRRTERICVHSEGRIVEAGTHDELVAAGGQYATMFALQASRFAADSDSAEET